MNNGKKRNAKAVDEAREASEKAGFATSKAETAVIILKQDLADAELYADQCRTAELHAQERLRTALHADEAEPAEAPGNSEASAQPAADTPVTGQEAGQDANSATVGGVAPANAETLTGEADRAKSVEVEYGITEIEPSNEAHAEARRIASQEAEPRNTGRGLW